MEKNKKSILEVKYSDTKQLNFQRLLEGLLANGYDFFVQEGQTEIWIYLNEPGWNIILKRDGTWKIE